MLESRWEDPEIPARENRPGRRLYRLTAVGEAAVREARRARGAIVLPGAARPEPA